MKNNTLTHQDIILKKNGLLDLNIFYMNDFLNNQIDDLFSRCHLTKK